MLQKRSIEEDDERQHQNLQSCSLLLKISELKHDTNNLYVYQNRGPLQTQKKVRKRVCSIIQQQFKRHPQQTLKKRISLIKKKKYSLNLKGSTASTQYCCNQQTYTTNAKILTETQQQRDFDTNYNYCQSPTQQIYINSIITKKGDNKSQKHDLNYIAQPKKYFNSFYSKQNSQIQAEQKKLQQKLVSIQKYYDSIKNNKISKIILKYSNSQQYKNCRQHKSSESSEQMVAKVQNQKKRSKDQDKDYYKYKNKEKIIKQSKNTLFCYLKRPKLLQNPQSMSKEQIQQFLSNPFHKNQQIKDQLRKTKRQMIKSQVSHILNRQQNRSPSSSFYNPIIKQKSNNSLAHSLLTQQGLGQSQNIIQSLNIRSKQIIMNVLKMQKKKHDQELKDLKFVPYNSFLALDNLTKVKIQQNFHAKRCKNMVQKINLESLQKSSIHLKKIQAFNRKNRLI